MRKKPVGNQAINNPRYAWDAKPETPNWVHPTIAGGWFVGLFMIIGGYSVTAITLTETLKWFLLFALIGTLIPFKHILKAVWLDYTYWIAANIIGIGPLLTGAFLLINLLFASGATDTTYAITEVPRIKSPTGGSTTIVLENNALDDYDKFRTFTYHDVLFKKSVTYTFKNGLFGYSVLADAQIEK